MNLRIWIYYFKNAIRNILEQRLIHVISMGTISIAFLLFGSFLFLFVNLNAWVLEWGKSLSMSVYIEDGIDETTKRIIEKRLAALPGVEMNQFISKEKAMEDLIEGFGAQSGLLDGLKKNPLPASYEIVFPEGNQKGLEPEAVKRQLEKIKGVDEVQYSEQWVERFEGFLYMLKLGGLIIGGMLCLAVLFITTNTIKLTIYARKDEIEILKLVGATDWFVKIPFLIEGAIQGFLSAVISILVLLLVYSLFSVKKIQIFGLHVLNVIFLPGDYFFFLLTLGLFLGLVGGLIAVGRFFDL